MVHHVYNHLPVTMVEHGQNTNGSIVELGQNTNGSIVEHR